MPVYSMCGWYYDNDGDLSHFRRVMSWDEQMKADFSPGGAGMALLEAVDAEFREGRVMPIEEVLADLGLDAENDSTALSNPPRRIFSPIRWIVSGLSVISIIFPFFESLRSRFYPVAGLVALIRQPRLILRGSRATLTCTIYRDGPALKFFS
jgi:hypothetical protein